MARNNHSYAKRQREIEKKRKADEKRARRIAKNTVVMPDEPDEVADASENPAEEDIIESREPQAVPPESD